MAYNISLYLTREEAESLFSFLLSIQAPSLQSWWYGSAWCSLVFYFFFFSDREIQTSQVKELEL